VALGAGLGIVAGQLGGCVGSIGGYPVGGDPGAGGNSSTGNPSTTPPTAKPDGKAPTGATVGPTALRRLSRQELSNTLRDLFPALPAGFTSTLDVPDDNAIPLAFSLPGTVSDLEVKRFMDLSESTLTALGTKQPGSQAACTGSDETACASGFIASFGKRAYRRPLDSAEVGDLVDLYTKLRTDPAMKYGFQDALGIVVGAILQSPGFLYRWERGLAAPQVDGGLVKFDNYEVASRLSYFIWKSMPDDALMAAADASHLTTPDQVSAQAKRLLADPRADQVLADFITQWLELGPLSTSLKDVAVYPTFKPELLASMRAETVAFSRDVLRGATPTLTNLLTARYTYVDSGLAKYYGVVPDGTGRADLSSTGRLGLLTQGSVMAVKGNSYRTSPVRRGKFVLNRLLCSTIPPPPPDAVPDLGTLDPTKTLRQQMAAHRANPTCAACHDTLDFIGYGFEHFDGAGNYRKSDGGQNIDSTGNISLDGAKINFTDANGLVAALAASPAVRECFTRQWLRYALDRFEQDADTAAAQHLKSFYEQSGSNTRDLIVEITRTLPFSHRAVAQGEVLTP
jgi:hypothetical protein